MKRKYILIPWEDYKRGKTGADSDYKASGVSDPVSNGRPENPENSLARKTLSSSTDSGLVAQECAERQVYQQDSSTPARESEPFEIPRPEKQGASVLPGDSRDFVQGKTLSPLSKDLKRVKKKFKSAKRPEDKKSKDAPMKRTLAHVPKSKKPKQHGVKWLRN